MPMVFTSVKLTMVVPVLFRVIWYPNKSKSFLRLLYILLPLNSSRLSQRPHHCRRENLSPKRKKSSRFVDKHIFIGDGLYDFVFFSLLLHLEIIFSSVGGKISNLFHIEILCLGSNNSKCI